MSTDASIGSLAVDGVRLPRLECPETTGELGNILTGSDSSILVAGSGSRLAVGNRGGPYDIGVSLRRLSAVLHYEPDDLTIALEPGITMSEVNDVLADRNQMLPFDDPQPDTSTVGGSYALGLSGPRRLGYGSLKDWVLGVEIMSPAGVVTKSGGMVVKNVTGYDLPRLHHGALGAFGIVTRLNLKVFPRPQATRSIVAAYETVGEAHTAAQAVLASQLEPTSVLVSNASGWILSVLCEGAAAQIERQCSDIIDVATRVSNPVEVSMTEDPTEANKPFGLVMTLNGANAVARIAAPPSAQVKVLELFQTMTNTTLCADIGSGLIYLSGFPLIEWREAIRGSTSNPVFLCLPPELKAGIDVFGTMDVPNAQIVTALKDSFDPARRLNRGRFVLGL